MGIFGALGRIVQGKPVFEVKQSPQNGNVPAPGQPLQSQPQPRTAGPKVYPQVRIERVQCQTPGNNLQCDIYIKNYSGGEVDIDRFEFFGGHNDLGTVLRPGESREFRIYNGPRPTNPTSANCKI